MKKLSIKEEYDLLKSVLDKEHSFIHNGSSRAVFLLPDSRVLKVAMDKQGRRQNANEVYVYGKEGNQSLAEIYAYGNFIVVMELVDEHSMEYCQDIYYECEELKYTDKEYLEVLNAITLLEEYNGSTDDNFQMGTSRNTGRIVAFDYGYSKEYNHGEIVSGTLADTVDYNGPEYIIENTMSRLQKLLDRNAKMCYNKL
jgi:hypothetical protein